MTDRAGTPAELAAALGHDFRDPGLLARALSHASVAERAGLDNERLEFLGDRVLGLLVAEYLLETHPRAREGELALRLNAAVRREACAEVARGIDLGRHLRLAKSEETNGGRDKPAILADACEALIAALYLDGGLEAARAFVRRAFAPVLAASGPAPRRDAKTALQEWAQAKRRGLPCYTLVAREGPDHAPVFTVEVTLAGAEPRRAQGRSRQAAEQAAAEAMLDAQEVKKKA